MKTNRPLMLISKSYFIEIFNPLKYNSPSGDKSNKGEGIDTSNPSHPSNKEGVLIKIPSLYKFIFLENSQPITNFKFKLKFICN